MIYHIKEDLENDIVIFRIFIQLIVFLNKFLNKVEKNY